MAMSLVLVLGVTVFAVSVSAVIEEVAFQAAPVVAATTVDEPRYFESGYYTSVDIDGDGEPDEWVRGEYAEGEGLDLRQRESALEVQSAALSRVIYGLIFGIFLMGLVISVFAFGLLDTIEERRERRLRERRVSLSRQ